MRSLANRIVAKATDYSMGLAELAIALLMVHVTAEVIMRRFFRISLDSVPEISAYYYMSALIFLALAYVTRADSHVSATLFTEMLPQKVQRILLGIIFLVLAATMVVFAWQTGMEAVRMTRAGELHQGATYNLPRWPSRWFAPIGASLMAFVALLLAIDKLTNRETFPGVPKDDLPVEQVVAEEAQALVEENPSNV